MIPKYYCVCFLGLPTEVLGSLDQSGLTNSGLPEDSTKGSCDTDLPVGTESGCLVEEEEKETGVVKFGVYRVYWKSVGACLAPSVLVALFLMQGWYNRMFILLNKLNHKKQCFFTQLMHL